MINADAIIDRCRALSQRMFRDDSEGQQAYFAVLLQSKLREMAQSYNVRFNDCDARR